MENNTKIKIIARLYKYQYGDDEWEARIHEDTDEYNVGCGKTYAEAVGDLVTDNLEKFVIVVEKEVFDVASNQLIKENKMQKQ